MTEMGFVEMFNFTNEIVKNEFVLFMLIHSTLYISLFSCTFYASFFQSGGELENSEHVANVVLGLITLSDSIGPDSEGYKKISGNDYFMDENSITF